MEEKNLKATDVEKVSGGVRQAVNGAYWLTNREADTLGQVGYHLSFNSSNPLPGWQGIETGNFNKSEALYQVNNPQNKRVINVEELADVINRANNENH